MKRKLLLIFLAVVSCVTLVIGLAACDEESGGGTHKHTYSGEWISDETSHWHICTDCGEASEISEHVWDSGVVTKEPTCTETGEMLYTCTVCSSTRTETYVTEGHVYSDEWSNDDTYHWQKCINCGETSDYSAHVWDNGVVLKELTCTESGETLYTCLICNATRTDILTASGHEFSEWASDETHQTVSDIDSLLLGVHDTRPDRHRCREVRPGLLECRGTRRYYRGGRAGCSGTNNQTNTSRRLIQHVNE